MNILRLGVPVYSSGLLGHHPRHPRTIRPGDFCAVRNAGPVFFSLWNSGSYPPGDWTWLPFYWIFGKWDIMQLVWSATWTTVAAAVLMLPKKKLRAWR